MSNLPWFKLYADARTDKKLGILTLAERGVWLNLLCYAAEQEPRGTFDASDMHLLALECAERDLDTLTTTIEKLLQIRHLVPVTSDVTSDVTSVTSGNEPVTTLSRYNSLQFRTFTQRQAQKVSNYPSDASDRVKDRVRKHRASKKQAVMVEKDVTSVTSGNGTDRDRDRENNISSFAANVTPMTVRPGRRETTGASRKQEPLWDVLVESFYDPQSKPERSNFGKIVRQLKELNATPEDVRARVAQHHAVNDWDLTPNALMSHWTELGRKANPSRPRQNQRAVAVPDIPHTIAFED